MHKVQLNAYVDTHTHTVYCFVTMRQREYVEALTGSQKLSVTTKQMMSA